MATLHLRERDLHAEVCARSHEMIAGGNARERDGLMMGVLDLEAPKMRCGVEPFQLQASGFDPTTADGVQVFCPSKYSMKCYSFVNILGMWTGHTG